MISPQFTIIELISILVFAGGLIGIYIAFNIRIAKIEMDMDKFRLETTLKITTLESKFSGQNEFLGARLIEFVQDNKDDHNELKDSVKRLFESVNEIKINLVKLTK